ncbi:MAG: ATP-binding protein [Peptococcaceae bacterium]
MKYKSILIELLLLVIVIIALVNPIITRQNSKEAPQADNGVLDLTNWDFRQDGLVRLNGRWEFYWNRLLTYDDFQKDHQELLSGYFKVPNVWNNYQAAGENLPGQGYGTYRLRVKTREAGDLFGLKILTMSTAYKVMINDKVIAGNGVVGINEGSVTPEYRPLAVFFANEDTEFEIIVQTANFIYARGGFWYPAYLGMEQQILAAKERMSVDDAILLSVLFIMALYHFNIYLRKRQNTPALYFGLMLFIGMIRVAVTGECLINSFFPSLDFRLKVFLEYFSMLWGTTAFAMFINEFFKEEAAPKIIKGFMMIVAAMTVFIAVVPIGIYTRYTAVFESFLLVMMCYCIFIVGKAIQRKKEGAVRFLIGIIIFMLTFVSDALFHASVIVNIDKPVTSIFGFYIVFLQSNILAQRFSGSFDKIENLSQRLLSLDKLKDEFLANTSHQLLTPLNGIVNISQSMLEKAEGAGQAQNTEKNLAVINITAKRLGELIKDILDFAKMKRDEINLCLVPVDAAANTAVIVDVFRYLVAGKNIKLVNAIPPGLPTVIADESRFRQVLYNLVGNAVKFTPEGMITIAGSFDEQRVKISITDTGIGIPPGKFQEVFQPFVQIEDTADGECQGTGLGLAISQRLLELMGGSIAIEWSQPGKGSRFVFTLPVSGEKAESEISLLIKPEDFKEDISLDIENLDLLKGGKYKILLVDDDPANIYVLTNLLADGDYDLYTALDGQKALNILKNKGGFDLVILDIMMPKISGFEVCRTIRNEFTLLELPVLLVTVRSIPEDLTLGFAAGANDFIRKPFDAKEVKARVRTLIELKNALAGALKNEMAFLQSQIKPHFLYNALNSISSLCLSDGLKASALIDELSIYLRKCFRGFSDKSLIPLESELELVKVYLNIEKARFGERLEIEYDLDGDVKCMIPPLVIQPLVENAVGHGLMKLPEGGRVKIAVYDHQDSILIKITDNGVGIPHDLLKELPEGNKLTKGVGMVNVQKRLLNIYGQGLNIESVYGKGTKISFKIPKNRPVE